MQLVATVAASLSLADEAALPGQNFNKAARGRRCFVASGGPTFTSSPQRSFLRRDPQLRPSGAGRASVRLQLFPVAWTIVLGDDCV
jgi:hypothetical protein